MLKDSILVFLGAIQFLMIIFILGAIIPQINIIAYEWVKITFDYLRFVFYECAHLIFLSLLLAFSLNMSVFVFGYNLCRKHRVGGTLVYLFSFILDLVLIAIALIASFLGILFSEMNLSLKFVLSIPYLPILGVLLFFTFGKMIDTSFFFGDVWRERKEFWKLRYSVEESGRITYVKIDASDSNIKCVLSAAPILLIEQALYEMGKVGSISMFLKNAVANFFTYFFEGITVWPRTRAFFMEKLTGAKVGKDCLIGQWTKLDPIFPDLIELEEDCGVGIGCSILTHSLMGGNRMTFSFGPVKICRYARVGANSVILPGVVIGEGAVVGSGSVVTKDVPPYTFVAGAPAKKCRGKPVSEAHPSFK